MIYALYHDIIKMKRELIESITGYFVAMLVIIVMSFCIISIVVLRMMIAQLLAEILLVRDDDFRVLFSDGGRLSTSELNCILSYVALNRS